MKTNIKKGLTISSLIAFGLLAGCSDDSSSVQSPATGDSGTDSAEATANICNADGYTGFYAADGATIMCLDANGSLAFWINPDGTIGTPVEEAPTSSAEADIPQDPGTTPLPPEDAPVIPSSASTTCDAGTATFLYKLANVSYYRDTDGATFFFDSDCNKQFLTEIVVSSSSETPAEKASSSSTHVFGRHRDEQCKRCPGCRALRRERTRDYLRR